MSSWYSTGQALDHNAIDTVPADDVQLLEKVRRGRTISPRNQSPTATAAGSHVIIDPKLFLYPKVDQQDAAETAITSHLASNAITAHRPGAKGPKSRSTGSHAQQDGKKKVSHARKQSPEHIPRPRNAFILFRKHVVDAKLIPSSVEMRHQNVSIITAKMWSEASASQKAHFQHLAQIEKEEHARRYPGYRYQPVYRRSNVIRRRVRKDEAEEAKCKSVAALLLKGKVGEALEEEIKEQTRKEWPAQSGSSVPSLPCVDGPSELSKGAKRALKAEARLRDTPSMSPLTWFNESRSQTPSSEHARLAFGQTSLPEQSHPGLALPHAEGQRLDDRFIDQGQDGDMFGLSALQTYAYPDELFQGHASGGYPQPGWLRHSAHDISLTPEFHRLDQCLPFSPLVNVTYEAQISVPPLMEYKVAGTSEYYRGHSLHPMDCWRPDDVGWMWGPDGQGDSDVHTTFMLPMDPINNHGSAESHSLLQAFGAALDEAGPAIDSYS